MYNDYFAFSEPPFSIVPDPRYLYMSGRHREALAHLLYGIEVDGGFVLLTGDIGTGKTTLCRCLLENLPEHCDVAFIYNPKLSVGELLATICEEFGIRLPRSDGGNKCLVDNINAFLLESHVRGRKALLIIDEAQNLLPEVLEQLRLLTNLETGERKLLQIILLGQPELQDMLESKELRQLAQRIVARYHLMPLSQAETAAYVIHRLTVAGSGRRLFLPAVLRRIYWLSKGVPRVINLLCDRALLGAYVQGKDQVDRRILAKAAREALGERAVRPRLLLMRPVGWVIAVAAALCGSTVLAIAYYQQNTLTSTSVTDPARLIDTAALPDYDALTWPAGMVKSNSESMSMAALFGLWGLNYRVNGDESFCRQAAQNGLGCLSGRGGLWELSRLNVPAVLRLNDGGTGFYAALTALKETTATLVLGDGIVKEVSLSALARTWQGTYTVLWRKPPMSDGTLKVGAKGEAVIWLRRQLAKASNRSTDADEKSYFDEDLVRQIREFQTSEGLPPEGIAGPLTLIRLSARTDADAPRLILQSATPLNDGL